MTDEIKMANRGSFDMMVIKPHKISHLNWQSPSYLNDLVYNDDVSIVSVTPEEYQTKLGEIFDTKRFNDPYAKVEMIHESKHYLFEMMFLDEKDDKSERNELAELFCISGTDIYGSVVITKTFLHDEDMNVNHFANITNDDMIMVLYNRANTTIIVYDSDEESYIEKEVMGNIGDFANDFFSDKRYGVKKIELGFLKHNINVWYTEDKYGELDVFGNILPATTRVDKMIVFTMFNSDHRGCIFMDEFNKIRFLSKKLEKYDLPESYDVEEKDELGRMIVKNKYRILNEVYNKYKN